MALVPFLCRCTYMEISEHIVKRKHIYIYSYGSSRFLHKSQHSVLLSTINPRHILSITGTTKPSGCLSMIPEPRFQQPCPMHNVQQQRQTPFSVWGDAQFIIFFVIPRCLLTRYSTLLYWTTMLAPLYPFSLSYYPKQTHYHTPFRKKQWHCQHDFLCLFRTMTKLRG